MITIYKSYVIVKSKSEDFMSRLIWKTKLVESLLFAKTNTIESDTGRPFIGQLNENKGLLWLTRNRTPIQLLLPKIIVRISINKVEPDNSITLKFKPGILTTIFYFWLIWGTIQASLLVFREFDFDSLLGYLIWIIGVVAGTIFLTISEISKVKRQINDILNLGFD